jgi:hypothetical protein
VRHLERASVACVVFAFVCVALAAPADAQRRPRWAAASEATIHPGVQMFTAGGQCTSNFVFYDAKNVYLGQAAHCSSTSPVNETNGCEAGVRPIGTKVEIAGADRPGVIVYNSWVTMQRINEHSESVCQANDFALVRIHPADVGNVNPSVPFWGGPVGFDSSTTVGELTYTYGDSVFRAGIDALSPKFGFATGEDFDGWSHGAYTLTPGISGDSGSAVLGAGGGALGILSTIELLPTPLENNVSDLAKALAYMKRHTSLRVTLADGTQPFTGLL